VILEILRRGEQPLAIAAVTKKPPRCGVGEGSRICSGEVSATSRRTLVKARLVQRQQRFEQESVILAEQILERFADPQRGGFFVTAADGERLLTRRKDLEDHPIPSGSSSAAVGLLRLAALHGEPSYERAALGAMRLAAPLAPRYPIAFGHLLCAIELRTAGVQEVALVGPTNSPARRAPRAPPAPRRARLSATEQR